MRWLSGSLALAAVSLLTACGAGKGPVAAAAAKSSKAVGLHIVTLLQQQGAQGPSIELLLAGDFDNASKRSSLILDLSSFAGSLGDTGASSQLFTGREVSDSTSGSPVFYLNVPFYSQSIPAARPWLKFDFATLARDEAVGLLELAELNGTEPRGQLDVLQESSAKFANLGQDEVDGALATHYQGQVDLQSLLAKLSGPVRAEIASLLAHSNGTAVPYNVWVGADGFVRRIEMQIAGSAGAQGLSLGLISDFSDYGRPVSIALPPAAQVTDLTVRRIAELTAVLENR